MPHTHPVIDGDSKYIIDPITRNISTPNSEKKILIQHDNNSERLTFECNRYVESHDLSLCDTVQVHYINLSSSGRQKSNGLYEVTDLVVDDTDATKIIFTWLISSDATEYEGTLEFLIKFACIDDDLIETYSWHTNISKSIIIAPGIENSAIITSPLPDIIATWKEDIYNTNYAYETAVEYGFSGTEEEWLLSLNGLSAYELAVKHGYTGTEDEWLQSLKGLSAYEIAVQNGFVGTEAEWLESQKGAPIDHTHTPESIGAMGIGADKGAVGTKYTISIEPDTADKKTSSIKIIDNASGKVRAAIAASKDSNNAENETSQLVLRNGSVNGRISIQTNNIGKKGLRIIDENGVTRVDISHNTNGDTCEFHINDASGNDVTLDLIGAQAKYVSYTDVSVPTSLWEEDSYHQYADFPYQAPISTSIAYYMYAEVIFSPADAISGNFAPICAISDGIIWIYAKKIPSSNITIPTIIVWG